MKSGKIYIYIAFLIIVILIFFILGRLNYLDPINLCFIDITEKNFSGSKKMIIQAIKEIKKEDFDHYKDICKYVDEIIEDVCFDGDPNLGGKEIKGCYIKGSKIIILPINRNNEIAQEEYIFLIKKLSQKSKEFWQNFENKF